MLTKRSDDNPEVDVAEMKRQIADLQRRFAELEPSRSSAPQSPSFILESITDAFVATDGDLRYVWVNTEAERFIGAPRESVLGRSITEIFPDVAGSTFEQKCRQALREQAPQNLEFYFARQGQWYFNKIFPTSEGGLAIYFKDITARKRIEADLRRQASVLAQVHDAIISTDLEGTITGWNSGACEIFGYTAEEAIGSPVALLYFEEERSRIREDVIKPLLRRGALEVQMRNRRKTGEECYIRLSLSLLRDEKEEPYGVLGVSTDITGQWRAEQALRESEHRYRSLANAMPHVAYVVDKDGKTVFVNDHWRKYSGLNSENASLGLNWVESVHPDDVAALFACWNDCLERSTSFEHEYRLRGADGGYRWFLGRALPVCDESGNIISWVGTCTDVHDHKMAEDALRAGEQKSRELAGELARANEELTHFANVVGHDLRTPLRAIITFTQLLSLRYNDLVDDEGRKLMRMVEEAASRMHTMLRDMLDLAKISGPVISPHGTSLEDALTEALENLRIDVEESSSLVTHDPLPVVPGDRTQIVRLFQNLVGNALKYRKPGSSAHVHVSAKEQSKEWVISVQDNGIGFEPEYADRIFGAFQRLHGREYAGTGIGLVICKRIVERHGGRIWAASQLGEGATFSFSWPFEPAAVRRLSDPPLFYSQPRQEQVWQTDPYLEEVFRILDSAPAMVRDLDGAIRVWTKVSGEQFGWSKRDAIGKNSHALLRTEFPKPLSEIEAEVMRTGAWSGELKRRARDGRTIWNASYWTLHRDGSGRPRTIIEFNTDITALRKAEQEIRAAGELRDLVLQAARMGVWRLDTRTKSVEWDDNCLQLFGMNREQFEGTFDWYLTRVHPEDSARVQSDMAEAFRSGAYRTEHRILRADGMYRWICGQGTTVRDETGTPIGLLGLVWDITEQKLATEALEAAKSASKA